MPINYRVIVQPAALHDMEDIVGYVAGELKNPSAAQKLAQDLTKGIASLGHLPTRCPAHAPIRPLKHEYRKLRVDNYLAFFWVSEEDETVTVVRVLYARRDFDRRLE